MLFTDTGNNVRALRHRLNRGAGSLKKYKPVWRSSKISKTRRARVVQMAPEMAAMYGLHLLPMTQKLQDQADAWQASALRRALRIPHSMISRVTNASVRQQADASPFTFRVMKLRAKFVAHCYRRGPDDVQRQLIFKRSSPLEESPQLWRWATSRKRGRPRQRWIDQAMNDINDLASQENCSEADILCEMRNPLFCKSVFGRARGATRALEAQDTLNE